MFRRIIDAGYGLPYLYRVVYYEVAKRADWKTGIAGQRTRINQQAFYEALYIEPAVGRKQSGNVKRNDLRRAIAYLCKNNYLKDKGNFVFEVCAITQDSLAQNKVDPQVDLKIDPSKSNVSVLKQNENEVSDSVSRPLSRPLSRPTSDLDITNNSGASLLLRIDDIPALFESRYDFKTNQTRTDKMFAIYQAWIGLELTMDLLISTVDMVNAKVARKGLANIGSPMYYNQEIIKALNHGTNCEASGSSNGDVIEDWAR